jgi:hypothetical protein
MAMASRAARTEGITRLARGAADWLLDGHFADSEDSSLYHGQTGVLLALQEAFEHFGDERYRRAVDEGREALPYMSRASKTARCTSAWRGSWGRCGPLARTRRRIVR